MRAKEPRLVARRVLGALWLAAGLFLPSAYGQPPAPVPVAWVDVHMHLIGGRGPQQDFAGALEAAIREMDRFGIAMAIVMPPPQVDEQPVYDASVHFLSLLRPDVAARIGRENAMRIYNLPPR